MIYANVDSLESMAYLQRYEGNIKNLVMSTDTKNNLKFYPEAKEWISQFAIQEMEALGQNIIYGVVE